MFDAEFDIGQEVVVRSPHGNIINAMVTHIEYTSEGVLEVIRGIKPIRPYYRDTYTLIDSLGLSFKIYHIRKNSNFIPKEKENLPLELMGRSWFWQGYTWGGTHDQEIHNEIEKPSLNNNMLKWFREDYTISY